MDRGKMLCELRELGVAHQELPRRHLVRGDKYPISSILVQQNFLWHRERVGIGDQILAELRVDVVPFVSASVVNGVKADGDAVGQFVGVVGMHQHPHLGRHVIDAMEIAFGEGAEGPQAGEHPLEGLVDAVLHRLIGVLGLGVVQTRAVEPRQVFVVGARPVAQGIALRDRSRA